MLRAPSPFHLPLCAEILAYPFPHLDSGKHRRPIRERLDEHLTTPSRGRLVVLDALQTLGLGEFGVKGIKPPSVRALSTISFRLGLVALGLAFKEGDLLGASLTPGLTLGTLGVVAHYIESKRSRGLDRQASSKDSLRFGARFAHQSFVSASDFALSDFMREAFSDFQRATTSALTLVAFR